nr:hypothetical protein Itr_chr05CG02400 [Ipomoea trifida]
MHKLCNCQISFNSSTTNTSIFFIIDFLLKFELSCTILSFVRCLHGHQLPNILVDYIVINYLL